MPASTQLALQKTLSMLVAQKEKTEREIQVIESALVAIGVASPRLAARRRRKPMTASERKSVSRRMKAYWATKKAKKGS